jgi:hypothetical protein
MCHLSVDWFRPELDHADTFVLPRYPKLGISNALNGIAPREGATTVADGQYSHGSLESRPMSHSK